MRAMQPDIPMTAEQVLESVGRYKMKSINDFTHFESTSNIGLEQFTLLNIYYPDPLDQYSFPDATEELTEDWPWDEAERLVKRSTSLQNILGALEINTKVKDIVKDSKHWPVDEDFEEVIPCQENPTWSPIASLVAKDEIKFPHFIVLVSHNDNEGDDDRSLRGEVLAILAMMITWMKHPSFEKHSIIPIMLLSFMNREGRIIQAYHDGQNLILHKSKLHEFSQRTKALFDLFVQYLASTPRGDTRWFLQRPTAAQQSTQRTQPTSQSTKETTKTTTETVVQPKHNQSYPMLPQSTEKPKSDVKSSTLPIGRRKTLGEGSGSQAEPA